MDQSPNNSPPTSQRNLAPAATVTAMAHGKVPRHITKLLTPFGLEQFHSR